MPSSDLIHAYKRALFRVDSPTGSFVLKVGISSVDLMHCYRQHSVNQSAYITAWNPCSQPCSTTDNNRAQYELTHCIETDGFHWLPGIGIDPDGKWPDEPSVLVLGIDEPRALAIGRKYGQHAIVYTDADAIPRLRFPLVEYGG